jgi:hypothetical protein
MGKIYSGGAATSVRMFNDNTIANNPITGAYGPYLWVYLPGTQADGYQFFGARVNYSY